MPLGAARHRSLLVARSRRSRSASSIDSRLDFTAAQRIWSR